MSEMIERVARAMAPTVWYDFDPKRHGSPVNQRAAQAMWLSQARTAIEAMREPSEAMLSCLVGDGESPWPSGTNAEFYGSREEMEANWSAAIDTALSTNRTGG